MARFVTTNERKLEYEDVRHKKLYNRAFILLPLAKILAFRRRANHFAESDTEKGQETERGM